jgi:hypothetical protein
LWAAVFTSWTVPGWTSLLGTMLVLGGMQLMVLWILGEYVGRLYEEVKQRPMYVVRATPRVPRSVVADACATACATVGAAPVDVPSRAPLPAAPTVEPARTPATATAHARARSEVAPADGRDDAPIAQQPQPAE